MGEIDWRKIGWKINTDFFKMDAYFSQDERRISNNAKKYNKKWTNIKHEKCVFLVLIIFIIYNV